MCKGPILMFAMGTPTMNKITKLDLGPTVVNEHSFYFILEHKIDRETKHKYNTIK